MFCIHRSYSIRSYRYHKSSKYLELRSKFPFIVYVGASDFIYKSTYNVYTHTQLMTRVHENRLPKSRIEIAWNGYRCTKPAIFMEDSLIPRRENSKNSDYFSHKAST